MSKFFLTTAIDYPNSLPHIGTAFEKIGAYVQARYRRFKGDDVFFLMGNDENTWKVAKRANELGEEPKAYVDRMALEFKKTWNALNISYDDFIQTTEKRHIQGVDFFLRRVIDQGFVYKKQYKGLYCEGCEAFKTTKEIEEGHCINHKNQELKEIEEENYFFKLSEFKQPLIDLLTSKQLLIQPESRYNEIMSVLNDDLEDISISRRNLGWGIPFPGDPSQVVYVWFDALLNYMTGCGYPNKSEWWPADIHFIGKDITRFHCLIWPAMILAYNTKSPEIAQPKAVFAHGFVKNRGTKIGKSTGNFVDPLEIVKEFGCDAYRYYFLSRCDYGSDGEYDRKHFIEVYNADLANNLGNLLSRVISMTIKYFKGDISISNYKPRNISGCDDYCKNIEECEYKVVLEKIWHIFSLMNAYVDENKPWALIKEDKQKTAGVLCELINGLRLMAILLKPFLPDTSRKIYESFNFGYPWRKLTLDSFSSDYNSSNNINIIAVDKPSSLFPKYEIETAI